MNKKIIKSIAMIILIATVLLISKNIQQNKFTTIYNIASKSEYKNLNINKNSITLLSNSNTQYTWSGDSCGKKEYKSIFEKSILDDEQYLCEISKGSQGGIGGGEGPSVTKKVTIEFTNLDRGYCWIEVYEYDGDSENYYGYYDVYSGYNQYTLTYSSNKDYKHYINCSMYAYPDENSYWTPYVDNLKSSDIESTEEVVRKLRLTPTISLDQDLNLISIKDKILYDNPLLSYNIDFSKISPQTTSYKKTDGTNSTLNFYSYYSDCFSDTYEFNSSKGTYKLTGSISCFVPSNTKSPVGKYTLSSTSSTSEYSYIYKVTSLKEGNTYNVTRYGSEPASYDTGLYSASTSSGTTYYYRGTVQNNYVKFAKNIWRIIRINENGTIRMILDGDIGSTKWNNYSNLNYYNAYAYGTVTYSPLITSSSSSERTDIDSTKSYCYSNSFTYDKSTNKYKLTGTITCKKLTSGTSEFYNMYTLFETSKTATSTKLRKMSYNYSGYRYYVYTYDTTTTTTFSNYNSNYCYGTDYTIENGYYKLAGTIKCSIALSSSSNSSTYEDYYTVRSNSSTGTSTTMYQYTGKSGYWNYYAKVFSTPVVTYVDGKTNKSNVKNMLDNWYNNNLRYKDNMGYLRQGTFCNDTGGITSNSYYYSSGNAYKRLYTQKAPSFDCTGPFTYGGSYNEYIGLITADEMYYAGASFQKINNNYYLAYKKPYWTMTPYSSNSMFASTIYEYNGDTENINGFNYESITNLSSSYAQLYAGDSSLAVRPVINIDGYAYTYQKNQGTKGDPYEIIDDYEIINAYWYGY